MHCIECQEGKHGACNGIAYIDRGDDVPLDEDDCRCAERNHTHGSTADGR